MSSDPVIAFLLDEVVVKDWCKRTFRNITTELQGICILKLLKYFDVCRPLFIFEKCALNIFH